VRLIKKGLAKNAIVISKQGAGAKDGSYTRGDSKNKRSKQEIPDLAGILIISILLICLISLPSVSIFAATQNSTQINEISLKSTSTPTVTPSPNGFSIPSAPPAVDPTKDIDYTTYTYHSWDIPDEITGGSTFWIEIDLTNQMLYAYRGNQLISGFLVSTGTSNHKTVTGTYKIYSKYPAINMIGPGYHLEDVPYSMFFYKGYAIHGTFWHNNFGRPMSHGCVNMDTNEAAWVYDNAPVGTYVFVHY